MESRIWTISNILSSSRIVLLIPLALLLLAENPDLRWYTIGLMVLIASTDMLDGYFARRFHQVSEIGKILDPLADKIAVGVVVFILALQGKIPAWFLTIVISRDVLIFTGGMYIKKTRNIILVSNQIGKWAVTAVAAFLMIAVLDFQELFLFREILLYFSTMLLILSFVLYLKRYIGLFKSKT
ncbi:MAG: CDP-alcohol phosphatidyltransferase family protein [Bacteroidota bacterium]|nr:CDP-alcohol phosphatidyltransferase family protein [Bacteroidota bacterium]